VPGWLIALAVTLVIEVPLVAALYPGERARIAAAAVVANVATNLALNLVLAPRGHLALGEVLAVVVEAVTYRLASRRGDLARATAVSAAANLASFTLGPMLVQLALR
jgi:hypothetical protein